MSAARDTLAALLDDIMRSLRQADTTPENIAQGLLDRLSESGLMMGEQKSPVRAGASGSVSSGAGESAREPARLAHLSVEVSSLRAPQSGPGLNLSAVNLARCTAPDGFNHPLASWSAAEWTNAVAGEAGEACNLAKKLIRHRDGVPGNKKPEDLDQDSLRRRIAEELADVVIYCDLAMASVGYDFATTVRDVFNRKSQELGSPYSVAGSGAETPPQPEIPK